KVPLRVVFCVSSRRRHTSFSRDWSSDVCSSDLHTLRQISENSLTEAGLSYAQYRILMLLLFAEQFDNMAAMNPSELSERQGISRDRKSVVEGRKLDEGGPRHLRAKQDDKARKQG